MKINLRPVPGYWDWTHDLVIPGEFNCPRRPWTWDTKGGKNDNPDPKARLNRSELLRPEEIGVVLKMMIAAAREHGCWDYEVINLAHEEE